MHWDSMLNQTNLKNNNNKFYLLQLLKDNTSGHYSTWFRWGRGDETRTHTRTHTHACTHTHTHTHCVTNCTSVVSVTDLNQASSVLYAWVAMHGYASFLSVIPLHIGIHIISYIPLCLHTLLGGFLARGNKTVVFGLRLEHACSVTVVARLFDVATAIAQLCGAGPYKVEISISFTHLFLCGAGRACIARLRRNHPRISVFTDQPLTLVIALAAERRLAVTTSNTSSPNLHYSQLSQPETGCRPRVGWAEKTIHFDVRLYIECPL